ncbi:MAG TPA: hypothetical protein VHL57_09720 [Flavobacteriales bacterium]|jgi:hypothetical protein|nr:hypothetical protein [Flavobacteriales bacterium]
MAPSKNVLKALQTGRKVYRKVFRDEGNIAYDYSLSQFRGQAASDKIREELLAPKPSMICRLGLVELYCVLNYIGEKRGVKGSLGNYLKYMTGRLHSFSWEDDTFYSMPNNAGFFPGDVEHLERFSELMLADMKYVDILGSWRREELFVQPELKHAVKVALPDLEPFYHKDPWSAVLEGKKVLVVHPYERSIQEQYKKHKLLFKDQRVLPDFELKTVRAVQSIANSRTEFPTWFDALEYMKKRISDTDFDIAILGCGAYGFPLAAHIKRIGKKAVHMGGATQLMFGIKGKRWEDLPFINEHWVRPSQDETPQNAVKVEGACYW